MKREIKLISIACGVYTSPLGVLSVEETSSGPSVKFVPSKGTASITYGFTKEGKFSVLSCSVDPVDPSMIESHAVTVCPHIRPEFVPDRLPPEVYQVQVDGQGIPHYRCANCRGREYKVVVLSCDVWNRLRPHLVIL